MVLFMLPLPDVICLLSLLYAFSLWVVNRYIFFYIFCSGSVIYRMAVFAST